MPTYLTSVVVVREGRYSGVINPSATLREKRHRLDKLVGPGFLNHPSRHGVIRDWHPGVQSAKPSTAATGASFLPRELSPARASVHETLKRPLSRGHQRLLVAHELRDQFCRASRRRSEWLDWRAVPGREASSVSMMMIRLTPTAWLTVCYSLASLLEP